MWLVSWNGWKSARLRRDAQYRDYQAQLNQFDQFDGSYGAEVNFLTSWLGLFSRNFAVKIYRSLSDISSKNIFVHDDKWKILREPWKFEPLGQKGQDVIWSKNNPNYEAFMGDLKWALTGFKANIMIIRYFRIFEKKFRRNFDCFKFAVKFKFEIHGVLEMAQKVIEGGVVTCM